MKRGLRLPSDWLPVLGMVVCIPLAVNLVLPLVLNDFWVAYVAQPAAWGLLAYRILRLEGGGGLAGGRLRPVLIRAALAIAAFQVYLMVMAGFFYRFGKSPNSFTPRGILINAVFVGAGLAGMEFSRAWLINRLLRKPAILPPTLMALLYSVLSLPWKQIPGLEGDLQQFTQFAGASFLPTFMEQLLASFLAMWGGPWPALCYRGVLAAFNWFCPVLPDLNWLMKALTGTVVPLIGFAVLQDYMQSRLRTGAAGRQKGESLFGWVGLSAAAIVAIWFSIGVFPVRPAVIYSGSMRPTFEVGDIVIVAKKNPALLKQGDIISFRVKDSPVPTIHRIIGVEREAGSEAFTTKGDANNRPDAEPAVDASVIGKAVFTIPRVGWASIYMRRFLSGI